MTGQLLLGLSLLVGLHEFGHFAFAKLFGIRVDKFYIFFDFLFPVSRTRRLALYKRKIGQTEYGIGWLPLGGYVSIHGMVNENQGVYGPVLPVQPDEFRAKPAWQRLLVMLGGVGMNVLTGIVIFALLAYGYGVSYLPAQALSGGVITSQLGRSVGLRNGDRLVGLNGRPLVEFNQVYDPVTLAQPDTYFTVIRAGQRLDLPALPTTFFGALAGDQDSAYVAPRMPFVISQVNAGDSAARAGLQRGDHLLALNGRRILYFDQLGSVLGSLRSQRVSLHIERAGKLLDLRAGVSPTGKLGIIATFELPVQTHVFTLARSLHQGGLQAWEVLHLQAVGIGKMLRREVSASASMAGPVEIAQQFGGHWYWQHFWELTATLSMVLAFMNLLPIPGLDGGHVVFLIYEVVLRRAPAPWFLQRAHRAGGVLLLSLMLYVLVIKQLLKLF